ncbi:MAG: energy transducer TonB [bacterium]|nr:energy transducer TonB [bacterium]
MRAQRPDAQSPLPGRPQQPSWPAAAGPRSIGLSFAGHATLVAAAFALTVTPLAIRASERPTERNFEIRMELARAEPAPTFVEPAYEVTESEVDELLPDAEAAETFEDHTPEPEPPHRTPIDTEAETLELPLDIVFVHPETEPEPVALALVPEVPQEPEPQPEPAPAATIETAPQPLADACPRPPYPRRAVRKGWEGTVVCRITIGTSGAVTAVDIQESSGHAILDTSVRETLLTWRFLPGSRNGAATETDIVKRFEFRLES